MNSNEDFRLFDYVYIFFSGLFSLSFKAEKEHIDVHRLWTDCKLESIISFEVFNTAFQGYQEMNNLNKKNIISIIDFSKPSNEKRFFVIDLENKHLKYECFVAHGKNSGDNYANSFSNQMGSLKSSLGFFLLPRHIQVIMAFHSGWMGSKKVLMTMPEP